MKIPKEVMSCVPEKQCNFLAIWSIFFILSSFVFIIDKTYKVQNICANCKCWILAW